MAQAVANAQLVSRDLMAAMAHAQLLSRDLVAILVVWSAYLVVLAAAQNVGKPLLDTNRWVAPTSLKFVHGQTSSRYQQVGCTYITEVCPKAKQYTQKERRINITKNM